MESHLFLGAVMTTEPVYFIKVNHQNFTAPKLCPGWALCPPRRIGMRWSGSVKAEVQSGVGCDREPSLNRAGRTPTGSSAPSRLSLLVFSFQGNSVESVVHADIA